MDPYAQIEIPIIVQAAERRCLDLGFEKSCLADTGRLLSILTAGISHGLTLELGTGGAYGTAWIASGLIHRDARLVTIDSNEQLADSARDFFSDWPNVSVLHGNWRTALGRGPFRLVFVDVSEAKTDGVDEIIAALERGGMVLLDDLTPVEQWPDEWRGKPDLVRDAWLDHPEVVSTEIRVAYDHAVILATRVGAD
ncbi:class I SAM-dependent methyltransferase [soil metagenome]